MDGPTSPTRHVTAHILIRGRVQGVAFRYSTRRTARRLGLQGWVRNLADGRVEALFQGPRPDVCEAVNWCKSGPIGARVDDIEVDWKEEAEPVSDFRITG